MEPEMTDLKTIIRCLESDLNTDNGRIRYAEMIARNGGDPEYAKAAEYFKQRRTQNSNS